jgi:hypothetical protein
MRGSGVETVASHRIFAFARTDAAVCKPSDVGCAAQEKSVRETRAANGAQLRACKCEQAKGGQDHESVNGEQLINTEQQSKRQEVAQARVGQW